MILTRTTPLPRALRWLIPMRIRMLRAEIVAADAYVTHAAYSGVLSAAELDKLRANITPLRVKLIAWEAQR